MEINDTLLLRSDTKKYRVSNIIKFMGDKKLEEEEPEDDFSYFGPSLQQEKLKNHLLPDNESRGDRPTL